jgi:hypothetical protein
MTADSEPRHVDPVESKILEAMDAGEFDDLPGAGLPIPDLAESYDPGWWARGWIERQRVADAANELRRLVRVEAPRLRAVRDRESARQRAADLNARIDEVNARLPEHERIEPVSLGEVLPPVGGVPRRRSGRGKGGGGSRR